MVSTNVQFFKRIVFWLDIKSLNDPLSQIVRGLWHNYKWPKLLKGGGGYQHNCHKYFVDFVIVKSKLIIFCGWIKQYRKVCGNTM